MKKILVAGATGLIGNKLTNKLSGLNHKVAILSRNKTAASKKFGNDIEVYSWDIYKSLDEQPDNWPTIIEETDAVINLAGENLIGRWSKKKKASILTSRTNSTKLLFNAIKSAENKPKVYVGASAIGYYGDTGNNSVNENSPAGKGFLAEIVKLWEEEQKKLDEIQVRRVTVRIGVVLAKEGGALAKILLPFRLFVGGAVGSGKQWVSWIHIDDLISVFINAIEDDKYIGVVNASSPHPVTMKEFAEAIGNSLKRPSLFNVPEFILKLVMGEAAQIVTSSTRVEPSILLKNNFQFGYTNINDALNALLLK